MRTITLPRDFVDLRNCPIDIHDIENNVRDFYGCLDIDEDQDVKTQCLDARSFLDSARLLVRNLISIEENNYMEKCDKAYFFMQENLGRVDKRLNEIEEEDIEKVVTREQYSGKSVRDSPSFRRLINSLVTCMEHLIYYPLKNALKKYKEDIKNTEGKTVVKEKNLFLYFLFLELLHSSESLGSITAEKTKGKYQSISPNQTPARTPEETYTPEDSPPALPENIEVEEVKGIEQIAEEFFNEPSEENTKQIFEDEEMEVLEEVEDESH